MFLNVKNIFKISISASAPHSAATRPSTHRSEADADDADGCRHFFCRVRVHRIRVRVLSSQGRAKARQSLSLEANTLTSTVVRTVASTLGCLHQAKENIEKLWKTTKFRAKKKWTRDMQHLATIFNPFLGTVSLPSSPRLCISTAMVHLGKMLLEVGSLKKNEAENMSTQYKYKQITNNIYILNVGPYCKHVVGMFELFQGIQRNDKANGRIFGGNRQPQASSRKKIATQGLSNTCISSTLESSLHCAFFMFLSPQKALAKGCSHLRYYVYI